MTRRELGELAHIYAHRVDEAIAAVFGVAATLAAWIAWAAWRRRGVRFR